MIRAIMAYAGPTLGFPRPNGPQIWVGRLREIAGVARATLRMSKETNGSWLLELRSGCTRSRFASPFAEGNGWIPERFQFFLRESGRGRGLQSDAGPSEVLCSSQDCPRTIRTKCPEFGYHSVTGHRYKVHPNQILKWKKQAREGLGTVPLVQDSDDDGIWDGFEVEQGTDPMNDLSVPAARCTEFPPTPVITGEDCGPVTLDAGGGYRSYLWSPGGKATRSIDVTPDVATLYSCEVVDDYSCTGTTPGYMVNPTCNIFSDGFESGNTSLWSSAPSN